MLARCSLPARSAIRPTTGHARRAIAVRSSVFGEADASNGTATAISDGARVKVVKPVKVYHVPKHPEVNLEGMEGVVQKNCTQYKGKTLSANLPYVVKFETTIADAPVKFTVHLADEELQTL